MKNPYEILNLKQDANKKEILQAKLLTMKERRYSLPEIAAAERQLLDPSKRLAADFMFPAKIKAKRPQKIAIEFELPEIDAAQLDKNFFDSLTEVHL